MHARRRGEKKCEIVDGHRKRSAEMFSSQARGRQSVCKNVKKIQFTTNAYLRRGEYPFERGESGNKLDEIVLTWPSRGRENNGASNDGIQLNIIAAMIVNYIPLFV